MRAVGRHDRITPADQTERLKAPIHTVRAKLLVLLLASSERIDGFACCEASEWNMKLTGRAGDEPWARFHRINRNKAAIAAPFGTRLRLFALNAIGRGGFGLSRRCLQEVDGSQGSGGEKDGVYGVGQGHRLQIRSAAAMTTFVVISRGAFFLRGLE